VWHSASQRGHSSRVWKTVTKQTHCLKQVAVCKTTATNPNSSDYNILSPDTAVAGMLHLHGLCHHSRLVAHGLGPLVLRGEERHEHHHQRLGLLLECLHRRPHSLAQLLMDTCPTKCSSLSFLPHAHETRPVESPKLTDNRVQNR
jgi:hypothetical protein